MKEYLVSLLFILSLTTGILGQLPHMLIQKAAIQYPSAAYSVTIGSDGTIFVGYDDGVRAFIYDGNSFTNTAHINNGGEARSLALSSDGTLFVANLDDGLRAYNYDGTFFTNAAHINNGGGAYGLALGPDETVFVANLNDGLRAYNYTGSSFINTAHYYTGDFAHDVAVGPDGTVFVANYWDGLRAYSYDGSSFTNTAHIYNGGGSNGRAFKVEVAADGTIFLGNANDGVRAYTYDGSSFTNTAHINNGGEAWGIAFGPDGTVFLANDNDGVRAYTYSGNSFTNTAHIDDGSYARDLIVGADGTVFLASLWDGVFSYIYSGYVTGPQNIFVTEDTLDFGGVFLGGSRVESLLITNRGSEPLIVSDIISSSSEYSVDTTLFTLNSYQSQQVEVTFTPSIADPTPGNLTILSNDPDEPEMLIELRGEGLIPPSISVMPNSLSENLFSGKTAVHTLTIDNSGGSDLEFNIQVQGTSASIFPEGSNSNYALQFNGLNSYIDCGNDNSLNISQSITVEAWIFPFDWNGNRRILQRQYTDDQYRLLAEDGLLTFELRFLTNGRIEAPLPPTNSWHHVAAVYDYQSGTIKLYTDGNLVAENSNVSGNIASSSHPLLIGTKNPEAPSGDFFNGIIDEVRIWETARSAFQIQQYMNLELQGAEVGLAGYWNFNEGSGNIVFDRSPNHNHGVLYNDFAWISSTAPVTSWLSARPNAGVVPADSSVDISAFFDASGLSGGGYDADIVIASNDPLTPEVTVAANLDVTDAPAISAEQDTLDFGQTFLGGSDTMQLVVENRGSLDLLISNTQIQPAEYSVSPSFASIDPGEIEVFTITFSPQLIGNYPGTFTLYSNDPLQESYIITLNGEGVEPPIMSVSPDSLSLAIQPGQSGSRTLSIENNGGSNLDFKILSGWGGPNSALQFDGIDDYVDCGYDSSLGFGSNESFSIEAWIKVDHVDDEDTHVISRWGSSDIGFYVFRVMAGSGKLSLEIEDTHNNGSQITNGITDLRDGNWHHIAGVRDRNNHKLYQYVDGVLDGFVDDNTTGPINNIYSFSIGQRFDGYGHHYGIIDEVRLWNIARTEAEIQADMFRELTGAEPGLVGYWPLNETSGNTTFDRTANANHGLLQGDIRRISSTAPITPDWFSVAPDSGICLPGTSKDITVSFHAAELDSGNYVANLFINSNDPHLSNISIPITLWITNTVDLYDNSSLPIVNNLQQNYPNPFNPATTIEFTTAKAGWVTLKIYNVLAEAVSELVAENLSVGSYKYSWDASGLPSGVYFYRLQAGSFHQTRKLLLLK